MAVTPQLDIFSLHNNEPVWLSAAETLAQALEIARNNGSGSYMVFSPLTGHKSLYLIDANGTIHPAPTDGEAPHIAF